MEDNKVTRVLDMYTRLQDGKLISKPYEAQRYQVNERTIQRDIESIRRYLETQCAEDGVADCIKYNRRENGYYLERQYEQNVTDSQALAICKILLDSRAFPKTKMEQIIKTVIDGCAPKTSRDIIEKLVSNALFHYIELHHGRDVTDTLWQIGQAIQDQHYVEIDYIRSVDGKTVCRRLKPAAVMFSEFYFYLAAFIEDEEVRQTFEVDDDAFPTIYRIDRIENLRVLDKKFKVLYRDRFEEGEFRKRIQFMYGGKLQRITFKYSGHCVEAVLDRLPTAKILSKEDGVYTITAEVFGKGIEMWLRGQGENVEVINS